MEREQEMRRNQQWDLRGRTKTYALRIIRLFIALAKQREEVRILGRQVLRSGTSVGAHYREAQRGKSRADFISKLEGALQELDETAYWLELLMESGIVPEHRLQSLYSETNEIIAILVTIVTRAKRHS